MDVAITRNNIDISKDVISYNRTATMCSIIGTCTVQLKYSTEFVFIPYDIIRVYEGGDLKGTYYVSTIEKAASEGLVILICQDESKKLEDYFIPIEYNVEDRLTYSKYWLSKILDDAHVSYTYETSEIGVAVSNYTTFGLCNAIENVIQLLQYSGWFMWFDATGVAHIGKIVINPENTQDTILDTSILHIETSQSDKQLRNRAIVWGAGDEESDQWVYASAAIKTPYDVSPNDIRTVVLSSGSILTNAVAQNLANKLLAETSLLTYIKTIEVVGLLNATIGQTVFVDSEYYEGAGLVTSKAVDMSKEGLITTIVLDERCPRILGAYGYDGYVYVSTTEQGVWRKPLTGVHTWANYSTGITDLNIRDLRIQNGIFTAVSSGGSIFTRRGIDSSWVRRNPTLYTDTLSDVEVEYGFDDVKCESATIGKMTNKIYAVFSTRDATVSGAIVETPWRSWITTNFFSPVQLFCELDHAIRVVAIENDASNIYCMFMTQISGEFVPGYNRSNSQFGMVNTTLNVEGFTAAYIDAPTPGETVFSEIIANDYCYYFDDGNMVRQHLIHSLDKVTIDANTLLGIEINPDNVDFEFVSVDGNTCYFKYVNTYYKIDFTALTIDVYCNSSSTIVFPHADSPAILGGINSNFTGAPTYIYSGASGDFEVGVGLSPSITIENPSYTGESFSSPSMDKVFYLYMNFGDYLHLGNYTRDAKVCLKIIDKSKLTYGFTSGTSITTPELFVGNSKYTFSAGYYFKVSSVPLNYAAGLNHTVGEIDIGETWVYRDTPSSPPQTVRVTWKYQLDCISASLSATLIDYEINGICPDYRDYEYTGPTLFYVTGASHYALSGKYGFRWFAGDWAGGTLTFYSLEDEFPNPLAQFSNDSLPANFIDDMTEEYYTFITGEGTTYIYRGSTLVKSAATPSLLPESDLQRRLFINGNTVYYIDRNILVDHDTGLFAIVPNILNPGMLLPDWYQIISDANLYSIGIIDPFLGGITRLSQTDSYIKMAETSQIFGTAFYGEHFLVSADDPIYIQNLGDQNIFMELNYSSTEKRCYDLKHFSLPDAESFSSNIAIVNENGIFYFDYNSARMDVVYYNDDGGVRTLPFTETDIDRIDLITTAGVKHFETNNYSTGSPYMFYSTRIADTNAFYQKDENLPLPVTSGNFILRNTSLPTSEITSIRCDDKI